MEEVIQMIIAIIACVFVMFMILVELAWPIMVPLLIISLIKKNRSNKSFKNNIIKRKETYKDISKSKLEDLVINDLDRLKDYLYDIFYNFENAYNSLDYNALYNTSTDKLYNKYHTNILLNLKFAQKKIIDQIKRKDVIIYDVLSTNRKQVISTVIEIEYVSYMQDHTGKIISGHVNPITESFEVTFIKTYEKQSNKCPNCGANINGSVCDYCGTNIRNNEFKIDSIKKIVK